MTVEAQKAPEGIPITDVVTDKSFRMCQCGMEQLHGYIFKGDSKLKVLVLGKRGGRRLIELLLEAGMITAEEKNFLGAQVDLSGLPDTFEEDGLTDVVAVERMFAEVMSVSPVEELLAELLRSLGGNVGVLR